SASGQLLGASILLTLPIAHSTHLAFVGSARPNCSCAALISLTACHTFSMPSSAISSTNLAMSAGAAGAGERPLTSHHLHHSFIGLPSWHARARRAWLHIFEALFCVQRLGERSRADRPVRVHRGRCLPRFQRAG